MLTFFVIIYLTFAVYAADQQFLKKDLDSSRICAYFFQRFEHFSSKNTIQQYFRLVLNFYFWHDYSSNRQRLYKCTFQTPLKHIPTTPSLLQCSNCLSHFSQCHWRQREECRHWMGRLWKNKIDWIYWNFRVSHCKSDWMIEWIGLNDRVMFQKCLKLSKFICSSIRRSFGK